MQNGLTIDARMIHHSGIGTYLKYLIPKVIEHFEVTLLADPNCCDEFEWQKDLRIIETKSGPYSIKEQFELSLKIPQSECFWSPHYNVPVFPIKAKKRMVTIHDVYHLAFYHLLSFPQKMYAKQMFKKALNLSDRIITVSEFSKSEILKHTRIGEKNITVIHNGVDNHRFKLNFNTVLKENVKKKYNLPDQFILFVGNIKPHKNLKNLIIALDKLQLQFRDIPLLAVGKREGFITSDTELTKLLNNDSKSTNRLYLISSVTDAELPVFYNLATVFAFPSFYEGFGLPPLESMASGCPVIASDIPPLRECCGNAAYFFDPSNPNDIARKIEDVLSDDTLRQNLHEKGLEQSKKFSWDNCAQQTLEVISQLLEET